MPYRPQSLQAKAGRLSPGTQYTLRCMYRLWAMGMPSMKVGSINPRTRIVLTKHELAEPGTVTPTALGLLYGRHLEETHLPKPFGWRWQDGEKGTWWYFETQGDGLRFGCPVCGALGEVGSRRVAHKPRCSRTRRVDQQPGDGWVAEVALGLDELRRLA